jgi:tetratricopeptide (TPR) repeat protein
MRTVPLALAVTLLAAAPLAALAQQTQPTQTRPQAPSQAMLLAGESLLHSATNMIHSPPQTPGRAGRLLTNTRYAHRLLPADPEANLLLAGLYETQDRTREAAETLATYLAHEREDYATATRWLALRTRLLNTADARLAFYKSVRDDEDWPEPIRSEAAILMAAIFQGQGDRQGEIAAIERALELDPLNPTALQARLGLTEDASLSQRVQTLQALLATNPRAVSVAADLARLLAEAGLYEQSLQVYDFAWQVARAHGQEPADAQNFLTQYLDAMLDAGQYTQAVERFAPMLRPMYNNVDFLALLAEAYRRTDQQTKARPLIERIEKLLQPDEDTQPGVTHLVRLAWFHLITDPAPQKALEYAQQASARDADNPLVQRVLGAAQLAAGAAAQGARTLADLEQLDAYSSALLAGYFNERSDPARARQVVERAIDGPRSGPGFRRLRQLAASMNITLEPRIEELEELAFIDMGTHPERYISLRLQLPRTVAPGEPIEARAVLTNTSQRTVAIGDWGLLEPTLAMVVEVGQDGKAATFDSLPVLRWAAPRYLKPGRSISARVRLDVGLLREYLHPRALSQLQLVVRPVLAPRVGRGEVSSALPQLTLEPSTIERVDVVRAYMPQAQLDAENYRKALGYIVRDIKRGDLPTRMNAAGKVASLLATVREVEVGKGSVPDALSKAVDKPVLLSMLNAVLKDRSPVVRAQMLKDLQNARVDGSIMGLLADTLRDESPLVRFRAAELIGSSDHRGGTDVLMSLRDDPNELVAMMSAIFLPPPRQRP